MGKKLGFVAIALLFGCPPPANVPDDASVCPMEKEIDGVCFLNSPPAPATRTPCGDVTEFCDKTNVPTPALGCLANPPMKPTGPDKVTMTGFIDVFSNGPDSKSMSIAVYDAQALLAGQDIATASPIAMLPNIQLDAATQRGCDTDPKLGCSVPSTNGCTVPVCNDGLMGRTDDKKYCRSTGAASGECSNRLRWEARYTLPDIPTNRQLVVRTAGPNGMADQSWAALVAWNVVVPADARTCADANDYECFDKSGATPKYQYNVNAISRTDYVNIPVTAGLAGGIADGLGAAAGEVHDCDNVRVENVTVEVQKLDGARYVTAYDRFAYFNGNPLKTLPDSSRTATDRLGLYTGLNVKPGKVHVVGAGLVGGKLTHFGSFDMYVYPNSVSVVNLNGGKLKP
jgi:hypothetical protein